MKRGISILLFAILVSGCMKHESLYNENKDREEAEKNFPVQNIDPNHDWVMAASRTLNVSMNEKTGKTYTVKLYSGYPFNAESDVRLLAQQQVKDGSTAIIKFDAPKVLERIFVMCQLDDEYVMRVSKLENEQFTVTFGAMEGRSRSARAASASRAVDVSKYAIFDDKAQRITNGDELKGLKKGVWYIDSEIKYKAQIAWSPGTCLYIKDGGRLILDNKLKLQGTDSFISVLEGGYLAINDEFKLNGDNGSNGLTAFYNAGIVDADDVELGKGLFINEGTFNAEGFDVVKDGEVWNSCRLIITGSNDNAFELKKNAVFNNEGYVHVTQGEAEWGEDDNDKVVVNMVGNAVFHIAKELDIEDKVKVTGTNGKPLIVVGELDFDEDASVVGTIYVSAKKIDDDDELPTNVNVISTTITDNGGCTVYSTLNPAPDVLTAVTTCAFEDMISESTDYDFNDVVFQVSNPIDNKITITLVAAGSTRAITAEYSLDKGENYAPLVFNNGQQEVHAAFGKSDTEIINTGSSLTIPPVGSPSLNIPVPVHPKFSFVEKGRIRITVAGNPIQIVSSGEGSKVEMEEKGKVPYALCVPIAWAYPTERTSIDKAYDRFGEWGKNMEIDPDWYKKEK